MKEIVSTSNAPSAIGPYSQAIKTAGLVFTSGQLPIDPVSGEIAVGDIEGQTRCALMNLKAVLEASASSLENVIKTTVFLADINDFNAMNGVYKSFFESECPARSAFQVAALPRGAQVEIEAVAAF